METVVKSRYTPTNGRRAVILSLFDIDSSIEQVLVQGVGPGAEAIPRLPLIEVLLEEFFYGVPLGRTLEEELQYYRVTTLVRDALREELRTLVGTQVDSALGGIRPYAHYSFKIVRDSVVLTEIVNILQLKK